MSDIGGRAVSAGVESDRSSPLFDAAAAAAPQTPARLLAAFHAGAGVGVLGGMIGLGGAEFRLPLLIGMFGFAALAAVILNKALSLVVVLAALPARLIAVPSTRSRRTGRWCSTCSPGA